MVNELAFELWRTLRDLAMYALCPGVPFALVCAYTIWRMLKIDRLGI